MEVLGHGGAAQDHRWSIPGLYVLSVAGSTESNLDLTEKGNQEISACSFVKHIEKKHPSFSLE